MSLKIIIAIATTFGRYPNNGNEATTNNLKEAYSWDEAA